MSLKEIFQVAGVDGCKAGWFVVVASAAAKVANPTNAPLILEVDNFFISPTFTKVLSKTTDCELVCVDIPIGLSDGRKPRQCDDAARKILGKRASSVFPTPIRPCLSAKNYETVSRICLELSGKKLSRQSFALLDKIRQVDDLMTPALQNRVREIHPEVCFWALNSGRLLEQNKKTSSGQTYRHKLLQEIFPDMDCLLAQAPLHGYAMDDAFDALVAAWTAGQAVLQEAKTLPDNPELDSKGLRMEIVYPA